MTFKFANLTHYIATKLNDIKRDAASAARFLETHEAGIDKAGEVAASVVGAADPALGAAALAIERSSESALASVISAIEKTGDAANANGVNISLDAEAVAAYKEALKSIEAVSPSLTKAPAGSLVAP